MRRSPVGGRRLQVARRRRLPALLAVPIVLVAALVTAPRPAVAATRASKSAPYYLALGDSLSRGYMPGQGNTDRGYVNDLYATLRVREPALRLVNLGCSSETTTTMRTGGICKYPGTASQLGAAERFLRAHRGQVRYVTLDIGANDVDGCIRSGTIDTGCVTTGLRTVADDLFAILRGLHRAAGPRAQLAAMTYYDPFLAVWLTGAHAAARESVAITKVLNGIESVEYTLFGIRVADVAGVFRTDDFHRTATVPGHGRVPVNVATICRFTFMCSQQNIHANPAGYRLIAATFATALRDRSHGQPLAAAVGRLRSAARQLADVDRGSGQDRAPQR